MIATESFKIASEKLIVESTFVLRYSKKWRRLYDTHKLHNLGRMLFNVSGEITKR